ncbi:selection and upkeep of intraepithelial T-cells protein 7-like [Micropterus dolomieu]|uniref:selection and upkeep of intraepithelial T-cells protein 7-like n=1 Tax=Micropterus dolomieu TaxID=147949 RepID=UPI001E8D09E8|nr:selection and upkeep of intraepithelial T-cells protein 7-like [Micropterus dolomieu]
MMKAALVAFSSLCYFVGLLAENGKPRAICPNPTIEAVEGATVTLQCYLNPPHSVVDYALDWTRDDLNKGVYSYRGKQENPNDWMDQYKGRSTLHLEDLSRGILTLQISSVQLADSGPYKCFISRLLTSCVVNVTVVHQSKKNTTRPPPDEPDKADGKNGKLVAIITSTVVVVLVFIVVGVLVRRGTIQKLMTRFRGRREQNAELTNGCELNPLRTSSANNNPDAENNMQVV